MRHEHVQSVIESNQVNAILLLTPNVLSCKRLVGWLARQGRLFLHAKDKNIEQKRKAKWNCMQAVFYETQADLCFIGLLKFSANIELKRCIWRRKRDRERVWVWDAKRFFYAMIRFSAHISLLFTVVNQALFLHFTTSIDVSASHLLLMQYFSHQLFQSFSAFIPMLSFAFQFSIYFQLHLINFFYSLSHTFSHLAFCYCYIQHLYTVMVTFTLAIGCEFLVFFSCSIHMQSKAFFLPCIFYIHGILFHFYVDSKLKIWLFRMVDKKKKASNKRKECSRTHKFKTAYPEKNPHQKYAQNVLHISTVKSKFTLDLCTFHTKYAIRKNKKKSS